MGIAEFFRGQAVFEVDVSLNVHSDFATNAQLHLYNQENNKGYAMNY